MVEALVLGLLNTYRPLTRVDRDCDKRKPHLPSLKTKLLSVLVTFYRAKDEYSLIDWQKEGARALICTSHRLSTLVQMSSLRPLSMVGFLHPATILRMWIRHIWR